VPIAYLAWSAWLIALSVFLLAWRHGERGGPSPMPRSSRRRHPASRTSRRFSSASGSPSALAAP